MSKIQQHFLTHDFSDITIQDTTKSHTFTCLLVLCLSWSHKYFIKFIGKINAYGLHLIYFPLYFEGSEGGSFIVFMIISSFSTFNCCFNTGWRHIKEYLKESYLDFESSYSFHTSHHLQQGISVGMS